MKTKAISVKNLNKVYKLYKNPIDRMKEALGFFGKAYHDEYYALEKINFDIDQGDIVGIIGENGAGKSTLLKIITGVLTPSSGEVTINGKISALLELGAGFNPEYTGIENIYLNGLMMGYSNQEMESKIESIVEFADIGEFIYQPVKTYSSGMFVRLAFSVAISIEPDILIVDEALSVGDAFFQTKSMTKMKELFEKGKTVLFVTHDMSTVKALCKKSIYLEKGKIIAAGETKSIVNLYEQKIRNNITKKSAMSFTENAISTNSFALGEILFEENEVFNQRVKDFREGNGNAVVTEIKLLNSEGEQIDAALFNERVIIRMYIKFNNDCVIGIGYHIRDSKNLEILGSNTVMEGIGEIYGKKGEKIVVDFRTNVPLLEGIYNITTVLSKIAVHNKSSIFEDYTQNGIVFRVEENKACKIWNKVYLENEINVTKI